jgi:hypothetical protein
VLAAVRRTLGVLAATAMAVTGLAVIPATPALACNDVAPYCDPVTGVIHDGTGIGALPQVPGDPSPAAAGIWLGNTVSAGYCFADHNRFALDADHDWLDDECEVQLARAFSPVLVMHPLDGCPSGEPYWAAKYFTTGSTEFVRIAYMPAYYADCGQGVYGFGGGHLGDSEFIMIGVEFNGATRHWQVREAYLSAHAETLSDSSDYIGSPSLLEYPVRPLAYPRVWIVRAKHANYRSQSECGDGAFGFDDCHGNTQVGRMLIYRNRNVGSRFLDRFPTGVMAENATYRDIWRTEFFYTSRKFRGWQPNFPDGVTPYATFLTTSRFECALTLTTCNWGPGPSAPASFKLSPVVDGPSQVIWKQPWSWSTFVTGGTLPYQATWTRRYTSDAAPVVIGTSTGSTFGAGGISFTPDRCEAFTIAATVTSADGQSVTVSRPVTITCPPPAPPPLSVYLQGPSVITAKGGYTYSAVTSGATGPAYSWSERFCDDQAGSSCTGWSTTSGLGDSYSRVLNPDCSGTGEKTFWVWVVVTNNNGQTVEAQQATALCQDAPL